RVRDALSAEIDSTRSLSTVAFLQPVGTGDTDFVLRPCRLTRFGWTVLGSGIEATPASVESSPTIGQESTPFKTGEAFGRSVHGFGSLPQAASVGTRSRSCFRSDSSDGGATLIASSK